ncbi:MAG: CTP synthase [Verrucomicrobia bacterium]|nr:CTP synthase [Verrucomicrobiota bacterium]
MPAAIALIGDYSPDVIAHRAIPRALELACAAVKRDATWQWVATRDLRSAARDLQKFSALWVVPASPYENPAGALDAIRWARETQRPFLGTCGGFQHALIEFARNVLGLAAADHAETNPSADTLVVTRLACSLVEKTSTLRLAPGSQLRAAYGRDTSTEGYHCNYGPAPEHRAAFERAGLRFTAFDATGEIRAAELPATLHPFFVGTLFQPERAALRGEVPPLVAAFVRAL